MKPNYIIFEETKNGVLSEMIFLSQINKSIIEFLDKRKIERVYEKTKINEKSELEVDEAIYFAPQRFFLHFLYTNFSESSDGYYTLTIYYKPNQLNELRIFIRQLFKQFNNETINN